METQTNAALGGLEDNPLYTAQGLPPFDRIRAAHVEPALRALCAEVQRDLEALEKAVTPTWSGLAEPLEVLNDRLGRAWGTVGHLTGVANDPALRAAHELVQPLVIEVSMRVAQSERLYAAWKALRDGPDWSRLPAGQQRVVECALRDAELAGIGLVGPARERFNAIQILLAEKGTQFSNHVLDSTQAWHLDLTEPADVEGLPPTLRRLTAHAWRNAQDPVPGQDPVPDGAQDAAEAGPWRLTLDAPCVVPFLQHAKQRHLREQVYRAYVTRASVAPHDNTPLLREILALRQEMAELLGYPDFAHLSLSQKMAALPQTALDLLEDLLAKSRPAAVRDLADIQALAGETALEPWDVAFFAERLRESRFDLRDETLRPYFPLTVALDGLFALANRLFGIRVVPADGETSVWHRDVQFFRVFDENDEPIAAFYLDPYSRPAQKRGGAWMDECLGRSRILAQPGSHVRLPVAYLICNQTPPSGDTPSLMTFAEVETLFHEFGHGLQHMLTRVEDGHASGIRNIEWDAVELPSQFMENWCFHRPTLLGLTRHYQTGEALPQALFDRLVAARTFRAGSDMLRQVLFALTDLQLHAGGNADPIAIYRQVAVRASVLPPIPEDRFLCAFSHIFAGGYAAGYFSYKWAEVLSADAFAAFEEVGLDHPNRIAQTGRRFRETVLAMGGSVHPAKVFRLFRGRDAQTDALLRHNHLLVDRPEGG